MCMCVWVVGVGEGVGGWGVSTNGSESILTSNLTGKPHQTLGHNTYTTQQHTTSWSARMTRLSTFFRSLNKALR